MLYGKKRVAQTRFQQQKRAFKLAARLVHHQQFEHAIHAQQERLVLEHVEKRSRLRLIKMRFNAAVPRSFELVAVAALKTLLLKRRKVREL